MAASSIHPSRNPSPPPHFLPTPISTFLSHPTPFRKRLPIRLPKPFNQLPDPRSSRQQLLHQALHLTQVSAIPLRGNLSRRRPHHLRRQGLQPRPPGFKRLPPRNLPVHLISVVDPAKRLILKPPLSRVKAISVI